MIMLNGDEFSAANAEDRSMSDRGGRFGARSFGLRLRPRDSDYVAVAGIFGVNHRLRFGDELQILNLIAALGRKLVFFALGCDLHLALELGDELIRFSLQDRNRL